MNLCPGCGEELKHGAMFCCKCGACSGMRCMCGAVCSVDDHYCGSCGRGLYQDDQKPDTRSQSHEPLAPNENRSLKEDAERDGKHFRLRRSRLDQHDIDEFFGEGENG